MFYAVQTQAIEGIIFSCGFCLFFVLIFLVLQATRLEECFKKGKIWQIKMAYFALSFVFSFILTYGLNYLYNLFLL